MAINDTKINNAIAINIDFGLAKGSVNPIKLANS